MNVTFNKFNIFTKDMAEGKHNLATDTLKLMLTNTAPSAANTVIGNITEIAAGNGYAAGGVQATQSSSTQTAGVYKLVLNDPSIVAVGGTVGPFRYLVLYNDTSATDPLIGWYDLGTPQTLADGDTLLTDFDAAGGVFTI